MKNKLEQVKQENNFSYIYRIGSGLDFHKFEPFQGNELDRYIKSYVDDSGCAPEKHI